MKPAIKPKTSVRGFETRFFFPATNMRSQLELHKYDVTLVELIARQHYFGGATSDIYCEDILDMYMYQLLFWPCLVHVLSPLSGIFFFCA